VLRMKRMVVREELLQYECFKKPTGVSQVPFRRAGFRHGLYHVIFGFQRFAQFVRETPNATKSLRQLGFRGRDSFVEPAFDGWGGGVRWRCFAKCVHEPSNWFGG